MAVRLDSWKSIADYLGREVRTVQRWEGERRLPVHRLPGGNKPRVYALESELDVWLKGNETEPAEAPSVEVLPFVNLTEDKENEYFSDGLADEIINALTRIPGLRVTARTSSFAFRGTQQDVREIGARLGAAALLEGSVRRYGSRVRVSAQLVSAEDGYHHWSECYDRDFADIFAMQDDIARAIALALRLRLAPVPFVETSTDDPEAYRLWLRGRYAAAQLRPETIAEARECFTAAIARDPRFPLPYVDVAELLFEAAQVGWVPTAEAATKAKEAVLKALALNDALGEAHGLLGALLGILEFDWKGADHALHRALELNPGSASILMRHAWFYLVPKLRIREALNQMRRAVAQDPFSPRVHARFALAWMVAREFERAVEECRTALELAPGMLSIHWFLGGALIWSGKEDEGLAECLKVYEHEGSGPLVTAGMSIMYGILGRADDARQMLSELTETARTAWVPPLAFAWAYLGLRDERVFEWLDKAIDARDPAVTHMPSMPYYDAIRNDLRFKTLLAKIGLA